MTMDEAKRRYVEAIKKKIEDVRSKYPTEVCRIKKWIYFRS